MEQAEGVLAERRVHRWRSVAGCVSVAMPLGKRWIGCMLVGIGLMLFGVSRQHWQEWSGFAILAVGIVLVLPERITGRPAR